MELELGSRRKRSESCSFSFLDTGRIYWCGVDWFDSKPNDTIPKVNKYKEDLGDCCCVSAVYI